eukprot:g2151.t1
MKIGGELTDNKFGNLEHEAICQMQMVPFLTFFWIFCLKQAYGTTISGPSSPTSNDASSKKMLDSVFNEQSWEMKFPKYEDLLQKYGKKSTSEGDSFPSSIDVDKEEYQKLISKYIAKVEERGSAMERDELKQVSEKQFADTLQEYWKQYPEYAKSVLGRLVKAEKEGTDKSSVMDEINQVVSSGENPDSFLEVASKAGAVAGGCEVCVYVVENKEQHQPFLCRGLKPPQYQQACVSVLVSLMWWLENQVYWLNYGCQRTGESGMEWVKPCPAHAVCSFIKSMYDRSPFCPVDTNFQQPSA